MFNSTQIGQGLGFKASKLLAWGLGYFDFLQIFKKRGKSTFADGAFARQLLEEDEELLIIIRQFLFLETI